jgi:hypothetical protein
MRRIIVLLSMTAALLAVTFPAAAQPLENDNFADAQVVTVKSNTEQRERWYSFSAGATSEAGENTCADQWSVWYTFTLTESMNVGISAQTYTQVYPQVILLETRVGLYAADGVTLLQCVAGGALKNAAFTEILNAGTYYVQVGTVSTPDHYRVVFQEPVTNDNIADAEELTLPEQNLLTKPGIYTVESEEPACAKQYTVWYKFTLDKRTQMSFFGFMATGDFLKFSFGLYRDDGELTPVDCRHSMITYTVFKRTLDAGTYYLQLGGESLPHFYQLIIHIPPVNDDLRNAKKVIFPYTDYAPVNFATFEPGIETHGSGSCGATLYHTVWYKFKLTEKMTVVLNADGYIYLDEIPVEDGGVPTHRKVYIDLWRKDGTGKTPIGCINRETPEMRKTLNAGTYFVRLASTKEGLKKLPSYYSFSAVVEPPGMPFIVDQPDDGHVGSGQAATLSVVATGTAPMTYQWYAGQTGDTSNPIGGATAAVYTTPVLTDAYNYHYYWVRVTNAAGSRDSNTARISAYGWAYADEKLMNGGFENGAAGWTVRNLSGDKAKCGTASLPPQGNGSNCAFVFKGGAGEKASLSQTFSVRFESGNSLRLRLTTRTTGAAGKLKAKVRIEGDYKAVRKIAYAPTAAYTLWQSHRFGPGGWSSTGGPDTVTLTLTHKSASGKMYVDDVSLMMLGLSASRSDAVLPPPAAPEGFRGGN